jgi:hypothetical protein
MLSSISAQAITIRPAYADDHSAIMRLAALDSAPTPSGPLLLGEVDGELWAAIALADDAVIADPFRHTRALVELLRHHAAAARRERPVRRPAAPRLRLRPAWLA